MRASRTFHTRPLVGDDAEAGELARRAGAHDLAVLHCVSAYPTPVEAENLRAIQTLARVLRVPVGLSDHGRGLASAIAAVTLGACVYERHLMLEADADVIDAAVSSTPAELGAIVGGMEATRLALGVVIGLLSVGFGCLGVGFEIGHRWRHSP